MFYDLCQGVLLEPPELLRVIVDCMSKPKRGHSPLSAQTYACATASLLDTVKDSFTNGGNFDFYEFVFLTTVQMYFFNRNREVD